ncbi:DUF3732 domain-containing protein [Marmoricola sp. URHB0036]|uniref:DUF3732 domain-containing protein n=1 Tax=Marmoricola sp. URHB0036 TaxID=1298863 RepID=UPI0004822B5D|nr:DUF3732 domain-containing protein [Marmoricola sp. URHB0036]
MQLLALALYAHDGRRRDVAFQPGRLNIVTGESKTGKSALLTITEFCLGRNAYLIPAGPITDHVSWYGSLWQLTADPEGPRAFVGRPAPPKGQASIQRAMLEFGGANLELFDFDQLTENADTASLRRQLGRRIGIAENVIESRGPGMNQSPFEAHLGHAAWLCLQDQDEIASRHLLFHRQGEAQVAEHLKDTIPYFLGAVPADAAAKKAALRDAIRAQRRAEAALTAAQQEASSVDTTLRGLLAEAHAAGLTDENELTERAQIIGALHEATRDLSPGSWTAPASLGAGPGPAVDEDPGGGAGPRSPVTANLSVRGADGTERQDRRRTLLRRRVALRDELEAVMDSRALLLDRADAERDFTGAVAVHAGRLTSLDLLPPPAEPQSTGPDNPNDYSIEDAPDDDGDAEDGTGGTGAGEHGEDEHPNPEDACPVCGSALAEPDASAAELTARLAELRQELTSLDAAPESRRRALTTLEAEADRLRGELAALEGAVEALDAADETARSQRDTSAARNYTRGRIVALLGVLETGTGGSLDRLRRNLTSANQRVALLQAELDPDADREQLHSRLNVVGRTMTDMAEKLGLEHVEAGVRLDLANLTVVTDTSDGPLPLQRIGSAANWIGYHLATHLALHKYFVENDRPVPRLLMVDQPTQAFYPSEVAKNAGAVADADREAVLAMFTVMHDLVVELAPQMQIIVSDHANLEEEWFQDAVEHYWRDGTRLVPADWIEESGES